MCVCTAHTCTDWFQSLGLPGGYVPGITWVGYHDMWDEMVYYSINGSLMNFTSGFPVWGGIFVCTKHNYRIVQPVNLTTSTVRRMAIHTMNGVCPHGHGPHTKQSMMRHATRPLLYSTPCAVHSHTRTASTTPSTNRIRRIRMRRRRHSPHPQVHAQCARVQHPCSKHDYVMSTIIVHIRDKRVRQWLDRGVSGRVLQTGPHPGVAVGCSCRVHGHGRQSIVHC